MSEELCEQCGKRPAWEFGSRKVLDIPRRAICFECGMDNLARSFEEDLPENPTVREISDGEQAGAFFRSLKKKCTESTP